MILQYHFQNANRMNYVSVVQNRTVYKKIGLCFAIYFISRYVTLYNKTKDVLFHITLHYKVN